MKTPTYFILDVDGVMTNGHFFYTAIVGDMGRRPLRSGPKVVQ